MLRSISKQHTDDRFAYDAARVQRNRFGGADTEINFNKLEMLEAGHPDSYGVFIKNKVTPRYLSMDRTISEIARLNQFGSLRPISAERLVCPAWETMVHTAA